MIPKLRVGMVWLLATY